MKYLTAFSFTVLLFGLSGPVLAHHSSAPHFDESVEISLEGTVTEWRFVNPHSYIYFDVTSDSGETVNWRCEMHAKTPMQRNGFTDETFYTGQKLTIVGSPARREDNVCGLTSFTFSDGTTVGRIGVLPEKYRVGSDLETKEVVTEVTERPKYLENGQPNISGFWVSAPRGPGGPPAGGPPGVGGPQTAGGSQAAGGPPAGGGGRPRGTQVDLNEAGLALQATYEQIYDNPSIQCDITNIFFGWTHDQNINQITQTDDAVNLLLGYMDYTRTIHLNMAEHPDNIEPSRVGHSIGEWQDDVLVVDTVGFTPGVFNPLNGEPYSDQMHSIEKFWFDEATKTLKRSYSAEDPVYLNSAYTGEDSQIISTLPYQPYACVELSGENNRRPEE